MENGASEVVSTRCQSKFECRPWPPTNCRRQTATTVRRRPPTPLRSSSLPSCTTSDRNKHRRSVVQQQQQQHQQQQRRPWHTPLTHQVYATTAAIAGAALPRQSPLPLLNQRMTSPTRCKPSSNSCWRSNRRSNSSNNKPATQSSTMTDSTATVRPPLLVSATVRDSAILVQQPWQHHRMPHQRWHLARSLQSFSTNTLQCSTNWIAL